jgi:2-haloalkanoic acid dehalogenase type II
MSGAMSGCGWHGASTLPAIGTNTIGRNEAATGKEPVMRLSDFSVLAFDCYGTLIDWESGMIEALKPLASRARRELGRDDILMAHARHESSQQRTTPALAYAKLLAVVYKRLGEEWGVPASWEECLAYGRSVRDWPAFEDSVSALQYLKQHYKLVILSNVDNDSFAFSNARLEVAFDAIYTAEDIGSYKPEPRNFTYMIDKLASLGVATGQVLHTAESLFHDHQPANAFDLASCWIHRRHGQDGFGATMEPAAMPRYAFRFASLAEFVKAHQAEIAG